MRTIQSRVKAGLLVFGLLGLGTESGRAANSNTIEIRREVINLFKKGEAIPIALSGFSGEVATALAFDLEVQGFEIQPESSAQFLIRGQQEGGLKAEVVDLVAKGRVLAKAYQGGSERQMAHAFADEVVEAITGQKGISKTRIAFKVDTGSASEIYVSDYDGYQPIKVTSDGSIVAAPCWGHNNRYLAYTSYKYGPPWILTHDLTTGQRAVFSKQPGLNTSVAISPNGSQAAMILSRSGSPDLYVADLSGGAPRALTSTSAAESSPCWSPDGSRLCFVSRDSGLAGLHTISVNGGGMSRLKTAGVSTVTEPDWSPDGRWIAFTSQYRGGFNVCLVPAEGGVAIVLTGGEDPSWAPNSRNLLFTRRNGRTRNLSVLDVVTKRVKDIARISGSVSQPSWAH